MRVSLIATLTAASVLAFTAGCTTTPTDEQAPAGVEDRKPGAAGTDVQTKPIARVDVTGKPGVTPFAVLKDPNNILSKRSIFYELDQYDVKADFRPLVEAHAKFLRENPTAKMLIQGNTDERGSREYNVGLGQRRSDGLKKMLVLLGARESQIESVSLGEEKPRADGSSEAAWAQNRRSDMLYNGEF
jgi:peptidoglycan-associated lipoprotein